jgi:hypothetical protein
MNKRYDGLNLLDLFKLRYVPSSVAPGLTASHAPPPALPPAWTGGRSWVHRTKSVTTCFSGLCCDHHRGQLCRTSCWGCRGYLCCGYPQLMPPVASSPRPPPQLALLRAPPPWLPLKLPEQPLRPPWLEGLPPFRVRPQPLELRPGPPRPWAGLEVLSVKLLAP